MSIEKVAVLGAGNGGCATAADLAIRGFETRLYSRSEKTLEPLLRHGGIELVEHGQETFGRPHLITPSLDEAVAGADLVTIAVPAVAHGFMARALAPLLTENQIVHLNPGQTGGSLHFVHELRQAGVPHPGAVLRDRDPHLHLPHGRPRAGGGLPAHRQPRVRGIPGGLGTGYPAPISPPYSPTSCPRRTVLETGLSNINAIMHPAGMVGNAGWIEQHGGELLFYRQALSPSVARLIEGVDRERLAIVRALGLRPRTFVEIFHAAGLTSDAALESGSVFQATQESEPNKTIAAPRTHDHRYVHEDVGYGLVPMAELAALLGIDTPVIDALVTLASEMNRTDYRRDRPHPEPPWGLEGADAATLRASYPKRLPVEAGFGAFTPGLRVKPGLSEA